ncbi:MAG: Fe-S cluster assembly protein SufD [Bryobacteraceae bacterium]
MIELKELSLPARTGEPAWWTKLRREAFRRFSSLGFPTTHDEDWKYTNVSPIARTLYDPGKLTAEKPDTPLADLGCAVRLVFVNGLFSPYLSSGLDTTGGIRVGNLAELWRHGSEALEAHLARYARFDSHAFVAMNTAFSEDGAFVEIARNAVVEQPIHLVFLAAPGDRPTASHPRTLVLAGRGSQAAVIETYAGPSGRSYFTNAVTEIVVGDGAMLEHYRIQDEGRQAFHVATVQAVQDRGSALRSHNVSLGASLARNDVNSVLDAEGAECSLNGLFVAAGGQHVDNHTLLDHAKPNCTSRELYKGILDGSGTGVFNGKIIVRKDAQKTNAIQSNKNLLLSTDAVINTKPQLEIYADDVRCTHGATVGQLDREAVFYLQSRGIGADQARDMLTQAFGREVLDQMKWLPVRERMEAELHKILLGSREGGAR